MTALEARVSRFRELIDVGRPYRVYELVLQELRLMAHYKNRRRAACQAHLGAAFYGLPELDVDNGYPIRLPKKRC